jgi:hypothetical protein
MKTALLGVCAAVFLSGCTSTFLNEPDYYMHVDYKGKKSFSEKGQTQAIYRCEETKKDVCLLFDKKGEYIDQREDPEKCFRIKGDKYCPIPNQEYTDQEKESSQKKQPETKEEKIKEKVKTENEKSKDENWWNKWWKKDKDVSNE